jgi:hypothetical protein
MKPGLSNQAGFFFVSSQGFPKVTCDRETTMVAAVTSVTKGSRVL